MARDYATAKAFRRALEDRLSKIAEAEQVQVNLRRQVAFDGSPMRLFRTDVLADNLRLKEEHAGFNNSCPNKGSRSRRRRERLVVDRQ